MLQATLKVNKNQPKRVVDLLSKLLPIEGSTIGLLGLAFKPFTDDMREAPSIIISNELNKLGAKVTGYDPKATETAKQVLPHVTIVETIEDLIKDADALIVVTEWPEFKNLQPEDLKSMKGNVIIDGRRCLEWEKFHKEGYKIKVIGQSSP